jgi:hypothetical protein
VLQELVNGDALKMEKPKQSVKKGGYPPPLSRGGSRGPPYLTTVSGRTAHLHRYANSYPPAVALRRSNRYLPLERLRPKVRVYLRDPDVFDELYRDRGTLPAVVESIRAAVGKGGDPFDRVREVAAAGRLRVDARPPDQEASSTTAPSPSRGSRNPADGASSSSPAAPP